MRKFNDDQLQELATNIEPDELPGDLPDIADLIGVFKALKLAQEIGGVMVYLKRWKGELSQEQRRYVDLIGQKDAEAISELFSGTHVVIPKCEQLFIQVEHQIIRDKLKSSTGISVAREHRMSERHIRRIKNCQWEDDDRQADLFDCNAASSTDYKSTKKL